MTVTGGKASPTITTTASASVADGGSVTDQATIAGGKSPTGIILYNLFGPADPACAGMPVFTSMATVTGNGSFTSGAFVTPSVGTYHWAAAYGGDANNNRATSARGATNESVVSPRPSRPCRPPRPPQHRAQRGDLVWAQRMYGVMQDGAGDKPQRHSWRSRTDLGRGFLKVVGKVSGEHVKIPIVTDDPCR